MVSEFLRFYEDQYGVALFNSMRHEIEGTGPPQAQLLWRKVRGAQGDEGQQEGGGTLLSVLWASVSCGCGGTECSPPAWFS